MSSKFRKTTAKGITAIGAFALANTVFLGAASAQGIPELAIPADKDWQHDWTPMAFPARIDGFERESISQFEERQTNVAGQYFDAETKTYLTVYIYRPGNADSAIWFDRALMAVGVRDIYGEVDLDDIKVGSFLPSGGTVASGQYAVIKPTGRFRSTAVSLYRAGEWLVKLRVSSQELSVSQMERLLLETVTGLPELNDVSQMPAYFIKPCDEPLSNDEAEMLEPESGLFGAMGLSFGAQAGGQIMSEGPASPANTPTYCRQGARVPEFNIYRPNESLSQYYLGVGDAGFGVSVAPDPIQALIQDPSATEPTTLVSTSSGLEKSLYAAFDGTPNVEQAIAAINGRRMAATNRPLGDEEQTINLFTSEGGNEAVPD